MVYCIAVNRRKNVKMKYKFERKKEIHKKKIEKREKN